METTLRGVGVSHGVAIGEVRHMGTAVLEPPAKQIPADEAEREQGRARQAVEAVAADLIARGNLAGGEAQAVLEAVVEGVYAVDQERNIRYLNPQAARMLGAPASELIGKFCGDVLKPRDVDGRRPCDFMCPIYAARDEGKAEVTHHLQAGGVPPGVADPAQHSAMKGPDTVDGIAPAGEWPTWWVAQTRAKRERAPWLAPEPERAEAR